MMINFPRNKQTLTYILSTLLLALFPAHLSASALTVTWDPNTEADLAGYKIYYGVQSLNYDSLIDVENVTQYTVRGLQPETKYYLAVTAYDFSGNESDFSAEVSAVTDAGGSPNPIHAGGGGGGCFIGTATYGSPLSNEVDAFRQFRDEYLLTNELGRVFVSTYYRYSPPLADCIAKHPMLRKIARIGLYPMLELSRWLVGEKNSE